MIVGIAGGIGSGKSVVSRILRLRGYGVYDCDYEAKRLMDNDPQLHKEMCLRFGELVVNEGTIDRKAVARHIFGDVRKRLWLNHKVHEMVRHDIMQWFKKSDKNIFIESAILAESDLVALCDEIWLIVAPVQERIKRVTLRNGVSTDEVMKRINAQRGEEIALRECGLPLRIIKN